MDVQVVRADVDCVDKIAKLFDAYRGFYGQPSHIQESYDFIAERITRDESAIFYANKPLKISWLRNDAHANLLK